MSTLPSSLFDSALTPDQQTQLDNFRSKIHAGLEAGKGLSWSDHKDQLLGRIAEHRQLETENIAFA